MKKKSKKFWKKYSRPFSVALLVVSILTFNLLFRVEIFLRWNVSTTENTFENKTANLKKNLFPDGGKELPVKWGDLGQKLVADGVIDQDLFESIYVERGGMNEYEKNLMYGAENNNLKITAENAGFLLNVFWGLGLSNKNPILEKGPMQDVQYGGAGSFASTGGWTLGVGDAMNHYSMHNFIPLTDEQQILVEAVSQNIYRPCCGNSTYFPDCNHGMAMLGFLELMASQNATEKEMYDAALALNSYWFPSNYLTIASYFEKEGVSWGDVSPVDVLGFNYSSSVGFRQVLSQVNPVQTQGGSGCSV